MQQEIWGKGLETKAILSASSPFYTQGSESNLKWLVWLAELLPGVPKTIPCLTHRCEIMCRELLRALRGIESVCLCVCFFLLYSFAQGVQIRFWGLPECYLIKESISTHSC